MGSSDSFVDVPFLNTEAQNVLFVEGLKPLC
jgi:hypothetical protein